MSSTVIDVAAYWQAIRLYCKKPHVINRRLAGITTIGAFEFTVPITKEIVQQIHCDLSAAKDPLDGSSVADLSSMLRNFLAKHDRNLTELNNWTESHAHEDESNRTGIIVVNKLLAKNMKLHSACLELVILGKLHSNTTMCVL